MAVRTTSIKNVNFKIIKTVCKILLLQRKPKLGRTKSSTGSHAARRLDIASLNSLCSYQNSPPWCPKLVTGLFINLPVHDNSKILKHLNILLCVVTSYLQYTLPLVLISSAEFHVTTIVVNPSLSIELTNCAWERKNQDNFEHEFWCISYKTCKFFRKRFLYFCGM